MEALEKECENACILGTALVTCQLGIAKGEFKIAADQRVTMWLSKIILSRPDDDVVMVIRRHNLLCDNDGCGGVLLKNPCCSLSRRSG